MDRIKIGVIGCGRAAENLHLPVLQKMTDTEVVALADVDKASVAALADRFQIKEHYTDYRELLERSSVDVAAVLVPAQFHVPVALAALDMNKHVFVEKPLALTLDEADRLIARARQSDRRIVVGFNLRKHRLIEQARKFVQEGAIGKIETIRSCWTSAIRYRRELPDWRNSRELGGGALFEIGVHHFDLWRFLLDSEVASIHAYSKTKHGLDETVSVSAQMANGVPVSALFSEQTSDANELEILGRKGRLRLSIYEFDGLHFQSIISTPGGISPRIAGFKEFLLALPTGLKIARQGGDYLMTYQKEWQDFVAAIRHGRAVNASLSDGRKALEITLAASESALHRHPVEIAGTAGRKHGENHIHSVEHLDK